MRIRSEPPAVTETSILVAPASTAFSINSLTTLAGRSMTSPAAILFTMLCESLWIGPMECTSRSGIDQSWYSLIFR